MTRLDVVQGDSAIYQMDIVDSECDPVDLSGYEVIFTIKRSTADPNIFALFVGTLSGGDIEVQGDDTEGIVDVTVPASVTRQMRTGRGYYWDMVITKADDYFTTCRGLIFAEGAANIHG